MAKPTDERETPDSLFAVLDAQFDFDLDVCATRENAKCYPYLGPESVIAEDAISLDAPWSDFGSCAWMNCPYSEIPRWLTRAVYEVVQVPGFRVVCLLPSNTSALWWQDSIWKGPELTRFHPWVERRNSTFWRSRITFAPQTTGAMWPSVVVSLYVDPRDAAAAR